MNRQSSSTSTSSLSQMIPSLPQPTAKRKASEDSNPLINAAKRAKKDQGKAASNKRKLLNGEEQPGGLLIVRAPNPHSRPSSAQGNHPTPQPSNSHINPFDRPPSRPPSSQSHHPPISTTGAGSSKPPSKKFRAESQPSTSTSTSTHAPHPRSLSKSKMREREINASTREDPEIEKDIRAMDDEADCLRRSSRAHASSTDPSSSLSHEFKFPSNPNPNASKRTKSKITDSSLLLPAQETPQIERNKLMREGAGTGTGTGERSREGSKRAIPVSGDTGRGHRRKSSVNSRGKRISSSFETTGVISQPHNSVSDSSFYKHIDCDLPDPERVRQLLIWCSSRAMSSSSSASSSQSGPSSSQSLPPNPPLPPLTAEAVLVLKRAQEDVVRMLAEKKIDLSLFPPEANGGGGKQKENEQNVTNRGWEITYGGHIQRAQEEDEEWKQVHYFYETHKKKVQAEIERRRARTDPQAQSLKAKGKRRATGGGDGDVGMGSDEDWNPREHELREDFREGVALAKAVLGVRSVGEERVVGPAAVRVGVGVGKEDEVKRRLEDVEFKLDQLYVFTSAARKTTNVAEGDLDRRFALLSDALVARSNPPRMDLASSSAHMLSTYVPREGSGGTDPQELLRALARVDSERPPAKVGDAARRAVREVQRAGESGIGAVGERRLTGVPPVGAGQTPRKMPGTPRKGGTPGREREREKGGR